MSGRDDLLTELMSVGGRTGVIVGLTGAVTYQEAAEIRGHLEERFPGVTFAVVDQCASIATFSFDDEATP